VQVTDELGYDGGAFFSHDGKQLVFRSTTFTPGNTATTQFNRILIECSDGNDTVQITSNWPSRFELTRGCFTIICRTGRAK